MRITQTLGKFTIRRSNEWLAESINFSIKPNQRRAIRGHSFLPSSSLLVEILSLHSLSRLFCLECPRIECYLCAICVPVCPYRLSLSNKYISRVETPRTIRSQRHAQSRVCVCDRIAGPVSARAAYIARVMLRCIALKVPTTIDSIMASAGRVTTTTRLQTTCRRRRRRGECTTLISAFINLNNNELIFFLPRLYLLASCGAVAKSTFTLWPRGFCPIGNVMISAYFRGPISHTVNGIDMCVTRG